MEKSSLSRSSWLKNAAVIGASAVAAPSLIAKAGNTPPQAAPYSPPIRFAVSTYSYWHFERVKYPIEKVIENASRLGFDGVEILHRQMESEEVPYMNKLKRMAFDAGLA